MANTYWNLDRVMRLIIGLAIAAALIWLVRYLSDVLLPFFVACFFAYLLQPVVVFNQRVTHTHGRVMASIMTVLEVTIIVGALVYLFLPTVIRDIDMLGTIIRNVSTGRQPVPAYYLKVIEFVERYVNPEEISATLKNMHIDQIVSKGTSLLSESIDVLITAIGWLLTLVYILFILIDYPQIVRGFKLIFPRKYRDRALVVVNDVKLSLNHYFRGQGVVALCACVLYCIGFSIVGMPLAIPMGILVGILYMIPYFQYVTLIPVAIICVIYSLGGHADFLPMLGKCGLVYVVSQCVCDYIITPHVMGREMGMNPAIILLSLSVWGSLLGIIGMIIALPVSALIMTYYERYISEPASAATAAAPGTSDGSDPGKTPSS